MIIFTESAHKEVLRRVELINHFQQKYENMLNISALNMRFTEYLQAYNDYSKLNYSVIDTIKSFIWGSAIYESKNELEWRLTLLNRELDALGESIVYIKTALSHDNSLQDLLSSDKVKTGKTDKTLGHVSISPDNTVYFKDRQMPKIFPSPIGLGVGSTTSFFYVENNNSSNTNLLLNSSNSNNNNDVKPELKETDTNVIKSLKL
jgi:hypothetical protein